MNRFVEDRQHGIATPELVALNYDIVGVGSRFVGIIIDMTIMHCVILVVVIIGILLFSFTGVMDTVVALAEARDTLVKFAIAAAMMFYFVLVWGYHVYFETLRFGRTPGKKFAGTRVIKLDGSPVTFRDSMIRNLLRIVDSLPTMYVVGTIACFASKKGQRLGDMAAGTSVVRTRGDSYLDVKDRSRKASPAPRPSAAQPAPGFQQRPPQPGPQQQPGGQQQFQQPFNPPPPPAAPYPGQPAQHGPAPGAHGPSRQPYSGVNLTKDEYQLITTFLDRSGSLEYSKRQEISFNVAHRIGIKYSIPIQHYQQAPEDFLRRIVYGG